MESPLIDLSNAVTRIVNFFCGIPLKLASNCLFLVPFSHESQLKIIFNWDYSIVTCIPISIKGIRIWSLVNERLYVFNKQHNVWYLLYDVCLSSFACLYAWNRQLQVRREEWGGVLVRDTRNKHALEANASLSHWMRQVTHDTREVMRAS